MKSKLCFLLALLMLGATACGEAAPSGSDTTAASGDTTAVPEAAGYDYPTLDWGGDDFTILNSDTTRWGFYAYIDFEDQTGEMLDDAVYNRNRGLEERYNFKLEVVTEDVDKNHELYKTAILAGDDVYDVAYIRCDRLSPFILDGYLINLLDVDSFRLEEPWWDQLVMEKALIGDMDALYFAANDVSLTGLDGTLCTYFNEDMLADLQLDTPYQLVRDGKWTIDKLGEYAAAGANLNGDDSFAWNVSGKSIYGLASYEDCINGFITGAGLSYIEIEDGQPSLVKDNEKFFNLFEKIYAITGTAGDFIYKNGAGNEHYEMIFKNGRALFAIAEIKASSKYRDMDTTFGIVPIPKYDENQKEYFSHRTHVCPTVSMPVTNKKSTETGIILDAMAYESYENILPIYYDVKVAQKGLRNEESIEMLQIIRAGRSFDIGEGYAWTENLSAEVNKLYANTLQPTIVSTLDSYRSSIEAEIKKTMEYMQK
ncbi:MAG: hypothetical protein J6C52_01855 [Clostridia bacterium]|nr:hypothetical protein [Clostridia bacterium]